MAVVQTGPAVLLMVLRGHLTVCWCAASDDTLDAVCSSCHCYAFRVQQWGALQILHHMCRAGLKYDTIVMQRA
jgi:hypothetical protein